MEKYHKDYEAFDARSEKLVAYYDGITAWEGQTVFGANIQGAKYCPANEVIDVFLKSIDFVEKHYAE
ncbi:MAG: hypothetical protein IJT32_07480 [Lachnospiraceae bacterium]|nr:hypothetical protein [Lachnospiraceae bacterium]